jgi:hypothetical protein
LNEASGFVHDWRAPKTDGKANVIAELQSELHAHKIAYRDAMESLARISYHSAQNGEDALHMRALAADFVHPGRKIL